MIKKLMPAGLPLVLAIVTSCGSSREASFSGQGDSCGTQAAGQRTCVRVTITNHGEMAASGFCDVGLGGKQLVRISSEIEGGMTYQEEQRLPIRQADIPDLSFLCDPGGDI